MRDYIENNHLNFESSYNVFLITGLGCDTSKVIKILAHRNAEQRSLIQQEFETNYSELLSKRLSKELRGHVKVIRQISQFCVVLSIILLKYFYLCGCILVK